MVFLYDGQFKQPISDFWVGRKDEPMVLTIDKNSDLKKETLHSSIKRISIVGWGKMGHLFILFSRPIW